MKLSTYLMFEGNCREAFTHYQKVLGGTIQAMMDHKGTPAEEHVPAEWRDKILHACLEIEGQLLMASDAPHVVMKSSGDSAQPQSSERRASCWRSSGQPGGKS